MVGGVIILFNEIRLARLFCIFASAKVASLALPEVHIFSQPGIRKGMSNREGEALAEPCSNTIQKNNKCDVPFLDYGRRLWTLGHGQDEDKDKIKEICTT